MCLASPVIAASDDAAASAYSDGWQTGDNGGSGFGAWTLTASTANPANAGYFIAASTNNGGGGGLGIDTAGKSWGTYANGASFTAAYRPFNSPLATGQSLRVSMDNGYIDAGSSVGFSLRNGNASGSHTNYNSASRFEFFFRGGDARYVVVDRSGERDSFMPFTDGGLQFSFQVGPADSYSFLILDEKAGSRILFTGLLATNVIAANSSLDSVALYNRNAGSASQRDAFFNKLEVQTTRVHYVSLSGGHVSPFLSWAGAATNIQAAVDVANGGDTIYVSNGVYETGGYTTPEFGGNQSSRVAILHNVSVQSMNGPEVTTIRGRGPLGSNAVRCAFLANGASLTGFTLTNGFAWYSTFGGGAFAVGGTLDNCIVTGNSAADNGGGSFGGTLKNCAVYANLARNGGGVADANLYNCTVTANMATNRGGGIFNGAMFNSIIYFNSAVSNGPNYSGSFWMTNCCSAPFPVGGNNITNNPRLITSSRLAANSPCVGAGSTNFTSGVDLDGEPWSSPPSIGCDEVVADSLTGSLQMSLSPPVFTVVANSTTSMTSLIVGKAASNTVSFGDGAVLTNVYLAVHAWSVTGQYKVVLRAYNLSYPGGVTVTATVQVIEAPIVYVWTNSPAPAFPYTNWASAAHTIQEAVDAQYIGGLVLVTNGLYDEGARGWIPGHSSNRVVITNRVILRSVNGPAVTVIRGAGPLGSNAIRCVYMGAGAALAGFTLTNGFTWNQSFFDEDVNGGGVFCYLGSLSNCVITGNAAATNGGGVYVQFGKLRSCVVVGNSARIGAGVRADDSDLFRCVVKGNSASSLGGGVYQLGGSLYNCLLSENSASTGGGAYGDNFQSALYNCTVSGNSASSSGGGTYQCAHQNTIVYFNAAPSGTNYGGFPIFSYSCSTPQPPFGTANTGSDPQFVNALSGDYRLEAVSPCIDVAANQSWMTDFTDLGGNSRIINGAVDMGAYELVFEASLKGFLQGAYRTNTHRMTLMLTNATPPNSPYAADARSATARPTNAVDWVTVELRRDTDGPPVFARSAWIADDGSLLSDTEGARVILEAGTGSHYLVLGHRNHLATMTAAPLPFTNRLFSCDFTAAAAQNYGSTNSVIEVESNVWALIAGDADGDGEIQAADQLMWQTQEGQ